MTDLTQFRAQSALRHDAWVVGATESALSYLSDPDALEAVWDEVLADGVWEAVADARVYWADQIPASDFNEGQRELVASLARHNVARKVRGWMEFRLLGEGAWLTPVAWGDVIDALLAEAGEPGILYRAECADCSNEMDVRTSPLDEEGQPRCESMLCMAEVGR